MGESPLDVAHSAAWRCAKAVDRIRFRMARLDDSQDQQRQQRGLAKDLRNLVDAVRQGVATIEAVEELFARAAALGGRSLPEACGLVAASAHRLAVNLACKLLWDLRDVADPAGDHVTAPLDTFDPAPLAERAADLAAGMRSCPWPDLARLLASLEQEHAVARESRETQSGDDADGGAQQAKHSIDFRSVTWFGAQYAFTAGQAAVVRVLWEAWANGTPDVGNETLLREAGLETRRLPDVFKDHRAWGAMIVQGGSKGAMRLQVPG